MFSVMVGMARRAVPAREVAGGTNVRATLACEGVAPLHAARTSQRDVIYQAKHIQSPTGMGGSQCYPLSGHSLKELR